MDRDLFGLHSSWNVDEDELLERESQPLTRSFRNDDVEARKGLDGVTILETVEDSGARPMEPRMGICPDGSIRPADWQARHPSSAGGAEPNPIIQAGHTSLSGSYAILGSRMTSERRLLATRDSPSSREAAINFCLDSNPSCLGASASTKSISISSTIPAVDDEVGDRDRESTKGRVFNNALLCKFVMAFILVKQ